MWASNFGFGSTNLSFFLIWPKMGPFCPFGPFRTILRVGDRFGNLIGTYLCRLSTLFLVAEPYVFFYSTPYGAFCALFGPFGAVLGLGPTHIDYQFWFWMYSPNFLFFNRLFLGPFSPFWSLWSNFWGFDFDQVHGTYLNRLTTFNLEV